MIVLTLVFAAIAPEENASALHHIEMPVTDVLTSISPTIVASPMNVVVLELALVDGAVGPPEDTLSLLFAI